MSRALLRSFVSSIAGVTMLLCSCSDLAEDKCDEICHKLGRCRFLPSPLGPGDSWSDNQCSDLCERSSGEVRTQIGACVSSLPNQEDKGEPFSLWCESDAGENSFLCSTVASCLQQVLGDAGVLGTATLDVLPKIADEVANQDAGPRLERCAKTSTPTSGPATSVCRIVETIEFFIEQGIERRTEKALSCGTAIVGHRFEHTHPGPVIAGAKLRWAQSGADQHCVTVYSVPALLRAGDLLQLAVPIPMEIEDDADAATKLSRCEDTAKTCGDAKDNDDDGKSDCADMECAGIANCRRDASDRDEDAGAAR